MDHYQFVFEEIGEEQKNILIAMLGDIGFEGFEEAESALKAFVKAGDFDEHEFENIVQIFPVKFSKSVIKKTNWNKNWESGFEPILVLHPVSGEPEVSIRAHFHERVSGIPYELEITPKMSFGTGHHATTYLMVQQMCLLDFAGKEVIDFGSGTGVLAIFAEKRGAEKILAIDNDEWSINNAKENIATNACEKVELICAETIPAGSKAEIILANINLNIIIDNLDAIKAASRPGADVLFSGIMNKDQEQITSVLNAHNFIIKSIITKDNWLIILAKGE